jgi:hypothetical protein
MRSRSRLLSVAIILAALAIVVPQGIAGASLWWADQEVAGALNLGGSAYAFPVSCTSASFCVTGGDYTDGAGHTQAYVSRWDGTSWTDQKVAGALNLGGGAYIYSVSCTSTSFCAAGGNYFDTSTSSFGHAQAFLSTWDGTSWADREVAGALNVGGNASIASESCVSASFCVAGGYYLDGSGHQQGLVSRWDGTSWTDQEVAGALNLGGGAYIFSVSCTSTSFCVVGGSYDDGSGIGGHVQAFVSTWNGATWTDQEVASALNVGRSGEVHSVSCVSGLFCVVGGNYTDGGGHQQAFVSTWGGFLWTEQEVGGVMNVGGSAQVLSVSCTSSSFCLAGGHYQDGTGSQGFVSRWDGSSWTDQEVAGTLNVGGDGILRSVSCESRTFCAAAGFYNDGSGHQQGFVSSWDGTSWTDQEVAGTLNVGNTSDVASISCTTSLCIAAGDYLDGGGHYQAFVSNSVSIPSAPIGPTAQGGNGSIDLSWSTPSHTGSTSVSDYLLRVSSDGGSTWQLADTGSTSTTYDLAGLGVAVTRVFEVAAVNSAGTGLWSHAVVGSTVGTAPLDVTVSAQGGMAITGGAMSWALDNGSAHSSVSYGLNAAGDIIFPAAPGGSAMLSMSDAQLPNGDLVSGAWPITIGIGHLNMVAPQEPAVMSRTVLVQDPTGVPVSGASVSIIGLGPKTKVGKFTFTDNGAMPTGFTDLNGQFSATGFAGGTPSATVVFDDGVITQQQTVSLVSPLTVVTLAYQPYVAPTITSSTATEGSVVFVTLKATSAPKTSATGNMHTDASAPLKGVEIKAFLAPGMSVGTCHAKLTGTTSSAGSVTLRLCASASGLVTFKAVGAYVRGGVHLRVKHGPPLAVTKLTASSPWLGKLQASWAEPTYLGGASAVSYKVVVTASGHSTITRSTTTRTINLAGLAHATRYTVTIYAATTYGKSLAMSVRVGVA